MSARPGADVDLTAVTEPLPGAVDRDGVAAGARVDDEVLDAGGVSVDPFRLRLRTPAAQGDGLERELVGAAAESVRVSTSVPVPPMMTGTRRCRA